MALALVKRGLPIFPCFEPDPAAPTSIRTDGRTVGGCSCLDPTCDSAGKHPRTGPGGFKHASTDAGQVQYWWRRWPNANIGLRTGCALPGGGALAVIDIDPRNNGDADLEELESQHGELPDTVTALTGSGGWHYYMRTEQPIRGQKISHGIDLKALGGYVIAPPSLHSSGDRYAWAEGSVFAPLPAWLLELNRAAAQGPAPAVEERIPHGFRDTVLTSIAGTMRRRGLVAEEILPALVVINKRRCEPPLPEKDLERIARSIERRPAARPVFSLSGAEP
jgi:putative DNA primase/helicase